MRMSIDPSTKSTNLQLVLSDGDRELRWYIGVLNKLAFENDNVIQHINAYWATLSPIHQQKIFSAYEKVKHVMCDVYDTIDLIRTLNPIIKELYDLHDLDAMSRWVSYESGIRMPNNMVESYIANIDDVRTREKTYIREDYKKLVVLGLALQPMIPIWGEFIHTTKTDTGTNSKEFFAVKLLNDSGLMECDAMVKLQTYITHNIKQDKPAYALVLNSVGTENFPKWLLSNVLVRKLCITELSCISEEATLISSIFNFIGTKIAGNPAGSLEEMVKAKDFNRISTDDANTSRLEAFKVKQTIAPGDIEIIEFALDDPHNIARIMCNNLSVVYDPVLLEEFLQSCRSLSSVDIATVQVTLAQYILKNAIPPRGLWYVSKKSVINAIAVSQFLVWDSFRPIACLLSATQSTADELYSSGIDSKIRIPPELIAEMEALVPYTRVSFNKKKGKVDNPVIKAIDEMASLLSASDWSLNLPPHMVAQVTGQSNITRYGCPQDIKIILAKLIRAIVKAPFRKV